MSAPEARAGNCQRSGWAGRGCYFLTYTGKVVFSKFLISRGVGFMKNKRILFGGRRHEPVMPRTPFKDSNGATIKECRRLIPDRRMNNVSAKLANVIR